CHIDRWVVCCALDLLRSGAMQGLSLHVNLSGRSLSDAGFLAFLREGFERVRGGSPSLDLSRLVFEVTETAAIQDGRRARVAMNTLREMGCRFALDDFGVGFSCFGMLRTLPVDLRVFMATRARRP